MNIIFMQLPLRYCKLFGPENYSTFVALSIQEVSKEGIGSCCAHFILVYPLPPFCPSCTMEPSPEAVRNPNSPPKCSWSERSTVQTISRKSFPPSSICFYSRESAVGQEVTHEIDEMDEGGNPGNRTRDNESSSDLESDLPVTSVSRNRNDG